MKNIRFLLASALFWVGMTVNAQQTAQGNAADNQRYNAGWNEFYFNLSDGNLYESGDFGDGYDLFGLSFNYGRGIHLSRSNGLTLRPSIGVNVSYLDQTWGFESCEMYFVSLTPKVDFGYHITFPHSVISLYPYAGIAMRINACGELDMGNGDIDLFASDEGNANRFQVGLRTGFDAHFKRFVIGTSVEGDLTKFVGPLRIFSINLKLGWAF